MKLTILGATGSIGVSTLDVVARHPDRFEVVALTGHSQVAALAAQCRQFRPAYAVVGSGAAAQQLAGLLKEANELLAIFAASQRTAKSRTKESGANKTLSGYSTNGSMTKSLNA